MSRPGDVIKSSKNSAGVAGKITSGFNRRLSVNQTNGAAHLNLKKPGNGASMVKKIKMILKPLCDDSVNYEF